MHIESLPGLTRLDELNYQAALTAETLTSDSVRTAIEIFRDEESFYHYPTYRQAVLVMKAWQELLCLDGAPKSIADFSILGGGVVNLSSYQDLCDPAVIDRLTGPFDPYLGGPFADVLRERRWRVVGFSVNFTGQLPVALRMARQVREALPDAVIVFGGTEVCDDVRLTREPKDYWRLFRDADIIVPGEGESPFCDILRAVEDGREFAGIRGILTRGEYPAQPPINYENVGDLPTPAYDVWEWDSYWTPEPVVLYSPTRGCYWNKCTFCDYGLNLDRPTSPSGSARWRRWSRTCAPSPASARPYTSRWTPCRRDICAGCASRWASRRRRSGSERGDTPGTYRSQSATWRATCRDAGWRGHLRRLRVGLPAGAGPDRQGRPSSPRCRPS